MNIIIIILSILVVLLILYILYSKLYSNKKVRFSNIKKQKEFEKDDNNINNNVNTNYDEMSFLEPDYETKRLEELKFDMI